MIRRTLHIASAAASLLLWAAPTHGAERMLSGDHDGFTRLVFAAPGDLEWTVDGVEGGKRISFDPDLPPLDVSGVFRRIGRDRLRALRQSGSELELDLACPCDLDIFQIASDHVVIDIRDAGREGPVGPGLPLILPPIDLPSRLNLDLSRSAEEPRSRMSVPAQVRRHDGALPRPLLLRPDASSSDAPCSFETFARPLLTSDPADPLGSLGRLRREVVDEAGDVDEKALLALAHAYLEMGWGPEALFAARQAGSANEQIPQLAAAFGASRAAMSGVGPDPTCGPASSLVAILTERTPEAIRRTDPGELARLLLDLPSAKRAFLLPEVRNVLKRAGLSRHLSLLPNPEIVSLPSERAQLAGTDEAAARAITAALTRAGPALDHEQVINAKALRQSLPPGPDRDALDEALASALMRAGFVAEAVAAMNPDLVSPERLLGIAVEHLPIGQVAAASMRLSGIVDPESQPAKAAFETLSAHGLSESAARLRDRSAIRPRPAPPGPQPGPEAATRIPTTRLRAVLEASAERPEPDGGQTGDLQSAAQVLRWASTMRNALEDLIQPAETDR